MTYVSTDRVAARGTAADPRLRELAMVPLGAALWTGAGRLAAQGITAIAHAASGAMTRTGPGFDPTRESIAACIANAFALAAAHGHARLALPLIAGGIFAGRVRPSLDKDALAALVVAACRADRGPVEAVIVAYGDEDRAALARALAGGPADGTRLVQGSITDFALHGATAIANAANMEVTFGGGISGVIGRATGDPAGIEREARAAVAAFWAANPEI